MSAAIGSPLVAVEPSVLFPRTNFNRSRMSLEEQRRFDAELREAPTVQPRLRAEMYARREQRYGRTS